MRLVWEGITAIRSTRAYCKWLRQHPEIEPPEYLKRVGMMDSDYGISRGIFLLIIILILALLLVCRKIFM